MRKVGKSRIKLFLNLISLICGAIFLMLTFILINVFSEPGIPMADAHPELYLPVMILAYAGIVLFVYGLIGFFITAIFGRGMRVIIDGQMLNGVKVYNCKYQPDTIDGLKQEVLKKIAVLGFSPLGDSGAYYSCGRGVFPNNVFCFAATEDFLSSVDVLLARSDAIWNNMLSLRSNVRAKDTAVMFFLALNEVTNEQLIKILDFKTRLLDESKAICDICLYSLDENRSYMTFTTMNVIGQPFQIEKGNGTFANICIGNNKKDIKRMTASKGSSTALTLTNASMSFDENNKNEPTVETTQDKKLDFGLRNIVYPKISNTSFIFSTIFGGLLLFGFILMLVLWLTVIEMDAVQFFSIFIPVLLLPGLLFVYFAVATYKKLELSRIGARLIRPFGNIKVFEGELFYAEKILASTSMYTAVGRRVFIIYLFLDSADNVFSANNYKKYIILRYCDYNKKILEKLTQKNK